MRAACSANVFAVWCRAALILVLCLQRYGITAHDCVHDQVAASEALHAGSERVTLLSSRTGKRATALRRHLQNHVLPDDRGTLRRTLDSGIERQSYLQRPWMPLRVTAHFAPGWAAELSDLQRHAVEAVAVPSALQRLARLLLVRRAPHPLTVSRTCSSFYVPSGRCASLAPNDWVR